MRPTISLQTRQITEAAGVALLRSSWTLRGTGPDGQGMEMSGNGIEVGIRRPDGNWVFVIDQPFGAD
jgi:ketosteroid isomerase-like protein